MWALIWWLFVKVVVPMAIGTGIALLTKKSGSERGPKPAGKDAFQLPTAEEGRSLPVLFGTRRIRGVNAVSPLLDWLTVAIRTRVNHKRVTSGWAYYIGLHMGVCHANIDGIKQIWFAETCVWPTLDDPSAEAADGQTTATVDAQDCWGGTDREGGVSGTINIQYGGSAQTLDSYLESKLGSGQPAYRGFTGLVLVHQFYIGTHHVLRPPSVLAKRTDIKHSDGSAIWYAAKAAVGADGDLNGVHILYELIFDAVIGLGKDVSLLGDSFTAAADTCYTEGYGLSCVWDWAPDDIASMIEQIEQIIDGKVYMDPSTGKFEIGLVRNDYDAGSLTEYGPDDFWIDAAAFSSTGTVPSKTIVHWHDRTTLNSRPATDDDIALLARQGGNEVVQEFDYSAFVCSGTLANTIAARDQTTVSAMPKRYTLRALRTMADLYETAVIKIAYPALNITSMIVRVLNIDRGSLASGECIIDVVEDVFGQSYTVYGSPPSEGVSTPAETVTDRVSDTGDYCEIVFTTGPTVIIGEDDFEIIGEDGANIIEE